MVYIPKRSFGAGIDPASVLDREKKALEKIILPLITPVLKSNDYHKHRLALLHLWRIGKEIPEFFIGAVQELSNELKNNDETVRRNAAEGLRYLSEDNPDLVTVAVPALTSALKDDNSDVRNLAASALSNIERKKP